MLRNKIPYRIWALSLMTGLLMFGELRAQDSRQNMRTIPLGVESGTRVETGSVALDRAQRVKFQFNFVGGSSELLMQYRGNGAQSREFETWTQKVAATPNATIDSMIIQTYYSATDERIGSTDLAKARISVVEEHLREILTQNGVRKAIPLKAYIRLAKVEEATAPGMIDPVVYALRNEGLDVPAEELGDDYEKLRTVEVMLYLNSAGDYSPLLEVKTPTAGTASARPMTSDQQAKQQMAMRTNQYPVWTPEPGRKMKRKYAAQPQYQSSYYPVQPQMYAPKQPAWGNSVNQVFAIKTNLPYWVALTPNVGFEFYMGHVSISLEGLWSFWEKKNDTGDKGIYVAGGSPEVRYWLNDDRSRGSHFFGIYGQYYDFDVKLNEMGRQGDAFGGGISYGYYLPVGNRWAFEFGIGIGALRLKYDRYEWDPAMSKNVWVNEKKETWIGPTKLKASVIFRIGDK